MAEPEQEGIDYTTNKKPGMLSYIGVFVLIYLLACTVFYFILKNKYEKYYAEMQAAADTTQLVEEDTPGLALLDTGMVATPESLAYVSPETTMVEAPIDTALLLTAGEIGAEEDTSYLAEQRQRVATMIRIIDKMKPKDTASIFAKLDDDFVVMLLLRMKDRNAAKVLSIMPASRAARLTAKISEYLNG